MRLVPAGHRILIKPDPVEEKTEAGIILHASESDKKLEKAGMARGTVESIGVNAWKAYDDATPWCSVGDRVIYAKYTGQFVSDPDENDPSKEPEEFVVINDEDIIVVLEPTE